MADSLRTNDDAGDGSGQFLGALRRRWWLPLLTALIGGLVAFAYAKAQPKEYTASASLLFRDVALGDQVFVRHQQLAAILGPSGRAPAVQRDPDLRPWSRKRLDVDLDTARLG